MNECHACFNVLLIYSIPSKQRTLVIRGFHTALPRATWSGGEGKKRSRESEAEENDTEKGNKESDGLAMMCEGTQMERMREMKGK